MISINGTVVKPTVFPDGTSQVWHLPDGLLDRIYKEYTCTVTWEFECEAELLWLAQLKCLLDRYSPVITLYVPYLPYARQDKVVSNGATFALLPFATLLNSLKFSSVRTLDTHNNVRAHAIENLVDLSARDLIEDAITESGADTVLLPDAGAVERYRACVGKTRVVEAEKVREQSTGRILSVRFLGKMAGRRVLIVDDLCDGGGTFVVAAKQALEEGVKEVSLYTTHGLYTKGLGVLRDAGIKRIFNRKGEVK